MSGVHQTIVGKEESGTRLDRWFKRRFPALTHGRLEKLLRTGQVRVDGARAKANTRLEAGQTVRIPPLGDSSTQKRAERSGPSPKDVAFMESLVLYKDDEMIALNKPAGLAVQGGSKTTRHIDGMLDALQYDCKDRPRLVHRLDRDTSGVMIVARTVQAASRLGHEFHEGGIQKIYWALVYNRPQYPKGTIDAKLVKSGGPGFEKMKWNDEEGRDAVTDYITVSQAADKFTWLALSPRTGRTHQIRAHCAIINTPIVGDFKYGAPKLLDEGELRGMGQQLCLHARSLVVPRAKGKPITLKAPLPPHMAEMFDALAFEEREGDDISL